MANKCTHEITFLSDVSMQSKLFKDSALRRLKRNTCYKLSGHQML